MLFGVEITIPLLLSPHCGFSYNLMKPVRRAWPALSCLPLEQAVPGVGQAELSGSRMPKVRPRSADSKGGAIPWGRGFTLVGGRPQDSTHTWAQWVKNLSSCCVHRSPSWFFIATCCPKAPLEFHHESGCPSAPSRPHSRLGPPPLAEATPRRPARRGVLRAVGDRAPPQGHSKELRGDGRLRRAEPCGAGRLRGRARGGGVLRGRARGMGWVLRGRAADAGAACIGHGRRRLAGSRQGWRGRRRRGGGSVSSLRPGRKEALGGHRV